MSKKSVDKLPTLCYYIITGTERKQYREEQDMVNCKYGKVLYNSKECRICYEYEKCILHKGGSENVKKHSVRNRAKGFSGGSSKAHGIYKERGI